MPSRSVHRCPPTRAPGRIEGAQKLTRRLNRLLSAHTTSAEGARLRATAGHGTEGTGPGRPRSPEEARLISPRHQAGRGAQAGRAAHSDLQLPDYAGTLRRPGLSSSLPRPPRHHHEHQDDRHQQLPRTPAWSGVSAGCASVTMASSPFRDSPGRPAGHCRSRVEQSRRTGRGTVKGNTGSSCCCSAIRAWPTDGLADPGQFIPSDRPPPFRRPGRPPGCDCRPPTWPAHCPHGSSRSPGSPPSGRRCPGWTARVP